MSSKIQIEFEDYDSHQERLLVCALAGFLKISSEQVQVISVRKGSVKVTVCLPHEAAVTLMKASKDNDVELFKSLDPLMVSDISMLSVKEREEPKSEDSTVIQSRTQDSGPPTRLFVGNLSFNMTENALQDAFAAFGTVIEANLMMDRMTGRPRGFAFVTMSNADEAQKAIDALNGKELDGRNLTIDIARPREERPGSGGSRRNSKNQDGDNGVA